MNERYDVWFMQSNAHLTLEGSTGVIHDGAGHNLYLYENGRLTPRSGKGVLDVQKDGRIVDESGNQVGFITDYPAFLSRRTSNAAQKTATTVQNKNNTTTQNTSTANKGTAAAQENKKFPRWLLVVFAIALVIYFVNGRDSGGKAPLYDDVADAAPYMKTALLNHDDKITFRYRSKTFNTFLKLDDGHSFTSFGIDKAFKAATAHTGNPNEGDQLELCCYLSGGTQTAEKQSDGTFIVTANLDVTYYVTKEQEAKAREKIASTVREMHLEGKSEYEKVRAIYNWICSHVTYDNYHYENDPNYMPQYTAYAAICDGTAVCSGYAQLFYRMALTAGLEARIKINDNHAWNIVRVDGNYYYCDATWDSGLPESQYQYFLKGIRDFKLHPDKVKFNVFDSSELMFVDYEKMSGLNYGE